jgi:TolB-like protein/tetratricopeptide (TPR) repeat protein
MSHDTPSASGHIEDSKGRRLDSWKEIAAYVGRDVTTVQRWERHEELPVHRLHHGRSGSVYAYAPELDAWRAARETRPAKTVVDTDQASRWPSHWWLMAPILTFVVASVVIAPHRPRVGGYGIKAIAVLPLENLSDDPEQEYFADGMTEALIARLSAVRVLRGIARTSVMQFKDTRQPVPELVKALNVDAIVVGSVLRSGGRVRITAQLIDGRHEEANLWSGIFERELRDVLALQSEVAQSIASSIEVTVTREERDRLTTARTVAPGVYESYLKGRFALTRPHISAVRDSIAHFEAAIASDPTFAPAYTGLSIAYDELGTNFHGGAPPSETRPKSLAAAERAVRLDPHLAEGHTMLASARFREWQWQEADGGFRRALDLDPNSADAHIWFALFLAARGDVQEAVSHARRGRTLDPLSAGVAARLGWVLILARQYDEAIRECRNSLELQKDNHAALWFLGQALVETSQHDEAIHTLERAAAVSNRSPGVLGSLAYVHARAGHRPDALRIVEQLTRRRDTTYVPAAAFVSAYVGLGDHEQAFIWLERAYHERSNLMWVLKVDPMLDSLRDDARFADLLRRVGLISS